MVEDRGMVYHDWSGAGVQTGRQVILWDRMVTVMDLVMSDQTRPPPTNHLITPSKGQSLPKPVFSLEPFLKLALSLRTF